MRKGIFILALMLIGISVMGQQRERNIAIIPEPVSLLKKGGHYVLPDEVVISSPADKSTAYVNQLLKEKLSIASGKKVKLTTSATNADIELLLNKTTDREIGSEGYRLHVTPEKVVIKANEPAGLLYGVQTLFQLLPPQIESDKREEHVSWQIPVVEIVDYPRVEWRGLMLDVSRHFFTVDEVKRFIDNMVKYKYNIFHWHLTDDEGWRIEIKSLPKLTEVGAWRTEQIGWFGSLSDPDPNAPKNYGGFYTQDEIREVIAYAMERNVQVMPEIDVPGHSSAVLAAYPELACFPESGEEYRRATCCHL